MKIRQLFYILETIAPLIVCIGVSIVLFDNDYFIIDKVMIVILGFILAVLININNSIDNFLTKYENK